MSDPTRYLALDVGEKRIGLAISESGLLARPHGILRRKSKREDFARINRLVDELNIDCVVVGIPYSLSDPTRMGPQTRRIERYAERLSETLTVPLAYHDESYSTVDAATYLAAASRRNKVPIDAAAAAVILQSYLDQRV